MKRGLKVIVGLALLTFLISPVLCVSAMEKVELSELEAMEHIAMISARTEENITEYEDESEVFDIIIYLYDDNMTEEEKMEFETEIRTVLTEYYLSHPEIIQEHLNNASEIVGDTIEEWIPNDDYLQYIERVKDGTYLGDYIAYDLAGSELSNTADYHMAGLKLGTVSNCLQHHVYYIGDGKYACVYDIYDSYQCTASGHSNCYITVFNKTYAGYLH